MLGNKDVQEQSIQIVKHSIADLQVPPPVLHVLFGNEEEDQ